MSIKKIPRKLYKYRSFGVNSLRILSEAEIFYANPKSFNDPLDCNPTIRIDTDRASLEQFCDKILTITKGKDQAWKIIDQIRGSCVEYGDYKTNPKVEQYYMRCLGSEIKDIIEAEMAPRGVLSMAERWDCPLMWSHYADEHRGLCIEYDLTNHDCSHIQPVNYNRPRSIKITDLIQWKLHQSEDAKQNIFDTYFFTKSPQWRYEKEWRDIHQSHGAKSVPFQISSVYFGLRCDSAVITSTIKLFARSTSPIAFYRLYPLEDSFRLKSEPINTDEIEALGVRTRSDFLDFKNILLDTDGVF